MPNDESLKLLAEYFGITTDELIPNKSNEEILVWKNKTIDQQKKVIIGFAAGCAIGLFILGFIFIEPLRESLLQLGLGVIFVLLGIFNMCGNIGTIHWYNRRKVTKENQKAYCMFVGLGTLIAGVGIIAGAVIEALGYIAASGLAIGVGVLIGLALMLYAQFKDNKGLFYKICPRFKMKRGLIFLKNTPKRLIKAILYGIIYYAKRGIKKEVKL